MKSLNILWSWEFSFWGPGVAILYIGHFVRLYNADYVLVNLRQNKMHCVVKTAIIVQINFKILCSSSPAVSSPCHTLTMVLKRHQKRQQSDVSAPLLFWTVVKMHGCFSFSSMRRHEDIYIGCVSTEKVSKTLMYVTEGCLSPPLVEESHEENCCHSTLCLCKRRRLLSCQRLPLCLSLMVPKANLHPGDYPGYLRDGAG